MLNSVEIKLQLARMYTCIIARCDT